MIFAGGRNYKDLDQNRFGQLMKFGSQIELSYFNSIKTKSLIESINNTSIQFTDEAIQTIHQLTAGHPFFSQCIAGTSFNIAIKRKIKEIDKVLILESLNPAIKSYGGGVLWLWDTFGKIDQIVLYILANLLEENKPTNEQTITQRAKDWNLAPISRYLKDSLKRLREFQTTRKEGANYKISSIFFQKWIVSEISNKRIKSLRCG